MVDIQESTLPNGLRVAVQPDDRIPLVGVSLLFDVGSRVETVGGSGFAHLFEHLMFQGSAHVAKGEFIREEPFHVRHININGASLMRIAR